MDELQTENEKLKHSSASAEALEAAKKELEDLKEKHRLEIEALKDQHRSDLENAMLGREPTHHQQVTAPVIVTEPTVHASNSGGAGPGEGAGPGPEGNAGPTSNSVDKEEEKSALAIQKVYLDCCNYRSLMDLVLKDARRVRNTAQRSRK
jgi:hypothetical protein